MSELSHLPIKAGLYRDDLLSVSSLSAREVEKTSQKMRDIFRSHGLGLKIEANRKVTDFLDVLRTPLTRQCNITAGQFPCLKKGCYEEHQVSCDWSAGDLNTHLLLVDRSATAATTARTDTTRASAETQPWLRRSRLSGAVHVYYIA